MINKMQTNLVSFIVITFVMNVVSQELTLLSSENGFCTYSSKKQHIEQVETVFEYPETFLRLRGFRYSTNVRTVYKTRLEPQLKETTEEIVRCCDGYYSNSIKDKCLPICDHHCIHGNCTNVNVCTCYDGYTFEKDSHNVCVPHCEGCTNGDCISPNLCQCHRGFDWDSEKSECIPKCAGDCQNGICVAPEQCHCNEGFHQPFKLNICIPSCKDHCLNGECIDTDKCQCNPGYELINGSNHECEPICELSCQNAKCIEPNVCECHSGYSVHDEDKPHECHCGKYCVEFDEKCHCLSENQRVNVDRLRSNDSNICTEANCINGYCLSPNDCECLDGFEKDENFLCVAVNETCIDDPINCNNTNKLTCDCINGVCASNDTCICVNGFIMNEELQNRCEPHCSKDCENGFCIDPDTCLCYQGYRLGYESEWYICHPICDPDVEENNGCKNGQCIAPNICECFDGFELSHNENFTCIPMPHFTERLLNNRSSFTLSLTSIFIVIIGTVSGIYWFRRKRMLTEESRYARVEIIQNESNESSIPVICHLSEEL